MPCLKVTGAASTAMLLRVVNLVAQHDLPFRQLQAEQRNGEMTIRIEFAGQDPSQAMVERLRSFVEVSAVDLVTGPEGRPDVEAAAIRHDLQRSYRFDAGRQA